MAVLAAATSLALLAPLYRASRAARSERNQALAIYRDQLGEVERDLDRGVIGATARLTAARTEISRRVLRAGSESERRGGGRRARARAVRHLRRSSPCRWRRSPSISSSARRRCQASRWRRGSARRPTSRTSRPWSPASRRIWPPIRTTARAGRSLAPVYLRLGRFDDAVKAYGNVIRLLGPTADRESDLGEALVSASRRHRHGGGSCRLRAGRRA